jgi:hypothetical protein
VIRWSGILLYRTAWDEMIGTGGEKGDIAQRKMLCHAVQDRVMLQCSVLHRAVQYIASQHRAVMCVRTCEVCAVAL